MTIAHSGIAPGNTSDKPSWWPDRWERFARCLGERFFLRALRRRQRWLMDNVSLRKLANVALIGIEYALKRERVAGWPLAVKIDISPQCNLRCTSCVHAEPNGDPALEQQEFHGCKRMTLGQYRRIIDEIKGKVSVVCLHYLGDPLVHPDLDEMCGIARRAGLNVQYGSNFSFNLSDGRLHHIVRSGATHIRVCVDGLSQRKYELTRVGGRIERVLHNLRRLCAIRRKLAQVYPRIEVQYLKFQHNIDELEQAQRLFDDMGVDQVTTFWGALHNMVDRDPRLTTVRGPQAKRWTPRCPWPYFEMVIKYNGDVVPCCNYRAGEQYRRGGDARIVGNVFETSVREVWNSMPYRQARRLASDPSAIECDPTLRGHFCYACRKVCRIESAYSPLSGRDHHYEDLYAIGAKGRPVRRSTRRRAG